MGGEFQSVFTYLYNLQTPLSIIFNISWRALQGVQMEATFHLTQVELEVRSTQGDSSFATVGWRQL